MKQTLSSRDPLFTISPPAPSTMASRYFLSPGSIPCNFFSHAFSLYITPPLAPSLTALSIFAWSPLVTYTLQPCATPNSSTMSATPPPIPVTSIFRPATALPLFTQNARHAVSPVSGSAAASSSLRCSGHSSNSPASSVMTSANVPAGFVFVPPRIA